MQQKLMNLSQLKNLKINMRFVMMALAFSLIMGACSKNNACKNVSPSEEAATLEQFNSAHNIAATKHYTGMYYQVVKPGNAARPTVQSTIFVRYKGTKLDGTVFDEQSNPGATGFSLSTLIEGWKAGLPLIGKGGRILLTIPSGMAYGCIGSVNSSDSTRSIPPNTPIYFEIELVDFY